MLNSFSAFFHDNLYGNVLIGAFGSAVWTLVCDLFLKSLPPEENGTGLKGFYGRNPRKLLAATFVVGVLGIWIGLALTSSKEADKDRAREVKEPQEVVPSGTSLSPKGKTQNDASMRSTDPKPSSASGLRREKDVHAAVSLPAEVQPIPSPTATTVTSSPSRNDPVSETPSPERSQWLVIESSDACGATRFSSTSLRQQIEQKIGRGRPPDQIRISVVGGWTRSTQDGSGTSITPLGNFAVCFGAEGTCRADPPTCNSPCPKPESRSDFLAGNIDRATQRLSDSLTSAIKQGHSTREDVCGAD